jgi:hypothetical protein
MFRIFSNFQNFQTLFRISSTKTGLFRISWLCSECYVIKFVSDLRQVSGFLQVLRFPPPIKLTATTWLKYFWRWH